MILLKYNKNSFVTELAYSDEYSYLVDMLENLTEELESKGIFLIKDITTGNLSRILEFSSIENGWECALMIVHGYVKTLKKI